MMKVFLMHRDRDFDPQQDGPVNEHALVQDLELDTVIEAMANGDETIREVARRALLASLTEPDAILFRQGVLKDSLRNASIVRRIYQTADSAIEEKKRHFFGMFTSSPGAVLRRSVGVLEMFVGKLRDLRSIADDHAGAFESEGFAELFRTLEHELDDDYFARVDAHLKALRFRHGVLVSAELGPGNRGRHYVLRRPHERSRNMLERLFTKRPPVYEFTIPERDDGGFRALAELRDRGLNLAANALAQSNDHILSFFRALRTELAFYVGCINLHERITDKGEPTCFPLPLPAHERKHACHGLYDLALSLSTNRRVVGNDLRADGKDLVIITGANQGGKTTFLRSIGQAQLMLQCGMFVPAASFTASVCRGLFTHFKREEDKTMERGKLDEELGRMSDLVDHLGPHAMVLLNESFAATNEREGSEIARQITRALRDNGVKVFFVTHLFEFAHGAFLDPARAGAVFLRAEREPDGTRTFKLVEGQPLETSYGQDLYRSVFGRRAAV
ncbi:MAG: DNA mismatch repair protein MutS [Thermoleophilia bacterium]